MVTVTVTVRRIQTACAKDGNKFNLVGVIGRVEQQTSDKSFV